MKSHAWVKPGLWGAFAGAVAIMIVGFSQFGWMLESKAEKLANDRASIAVAEALAPICSARFFAQPDAGAKLADLKKLSDYQQRDFVEKGGWANAVETAVPNYELVAACAKRILATKPT